MPILDASELLTSEIVANATMNRERGFVGVNSYTRELRFDIPAFLEERVQERGQAVWYDACCGRGQALIEAGEHFASNDWGCKVHLVGVDLIDLFGFRTASNIRLIAADVGAFRLDAPADLVTCVHGLHYLGDKLGFLQSAYGMLASGGVLLGHLDAQNLRLPISWAALLRQTQAKSISINLKSRLLRLDRGEAALDFDLAYQGASVSEQPNYTGITVIDSWYSHPAVSGDGGEI